MNGAQLRLPPVVSMARWKHELNCYSRIAVPGVLGQTDRSIVTSSPNCVKYETVVKHRIHLVIPAKAGIHLAGGQAGFPLSRE